MFEVYSKQWRDWVTVYHVSYDSNGYPLFLVWHDGQWIRKSAKHFEPPKEAQP